MKAALAGRHAFRFSSLRATPPVRAPVADAASVSLSSPSSSPRPSPSRIHVRFSAGRRATPSGQQPPLEHCTRTLPVPVTPRAAPATIRRAPPLPRRSRAAQRLRQSPRLCSPTRIAPRFRLPSPLTVCATSSTTSNTESQRCASRTHCPVPSIQLFFFPSSISCAIGRERETERVGVSLASGAKRTRERVPLMPIGYRTERHGLKEKERCVCE